MSNKYLSKIHRAWMTHPMRGNALNFSHPQLIHISTSGTFELHFSQFCESPRPSCTSTAPSGPAAPLLPGRGPDPKAPGQGLSETFKEASYCFSILEVHIGILGH